MDLTFEQIASAVQGAARVENGSDGIAFYRFSEEQEALYRREHPNHLNATFTSAGVTIAFRTNSESLKLSALLAKAISRHYYSFDVTVNDRLAGHMDNVDLPEGSRPLISGQYPFGEQEKTFSLGEGEKEVVIHLPWTAKTTVKKLALDDGALFIPLPPKKKLLAFGDSITQGYDAFRPMNAYIARTAKGLDMTLFNKGIGGERFFPELALCHEDFTPDLITVAYGTNDWSLIPTRKEYEENCRAFFRNLRETYPDSKIAALTPIWRKDRDTEGKCCLFDELKTIFAEAVSPLSNAMLLEGDDFVPHDPNLFSDRYLHPKDEGFRYYADNLLAELKKRL